MERAAARCCGDTVGRVRMARGPDSRGSRPWGCLRLLLRLAAVCAKCERPCVKAGSEGCADPAVRGSEVGVVGSEGWICSVDEEEKSGFQNSTTLRAAAKMPVCTTCTLMLWLVDSLSLPCARNSASTFSRAVASSRRTAIHSVDLRLLCWKTTISGVERRRDWYCRSNCDLRNSGGLWEGGWFRG